MKKHVPLILIIFFAIFLRFWQIETVPPSMYWDEVSQGYNAYSILQTGRDEHQESFPIIRFQAFGDYKAPVYIYLDVPFIALFGKTTLAVRFPSALFGSMTVLLTYFLVCELFYSHKNKKMLGLLTSFLLAISPWHMQLSRGAYEANIATFFTVLGIVLFFLGKRTKNWLLILSVISFVFSFYAFNAHRIFIPLFTIFLGILYWRELLISRRKVICSCIMGFTLLLPFLFYLRSPESKLRFNEVNIFSDISVIKESNKLIAQEGSTKISQIINNRRVLFGLLYMHHYFDFFNPSYLFFSGDVNPRFSLRDNGELFLWELPFLIIGGYLLFKERSRPAFVILGWFVLAPIAAATARETPHALRSETYLPTFQIISAFGMVWGFEKINALHTLIKKMIILLCYTIIIISLYLFLHDYFVHFPRTFSYDWQYGYKQAVEEAEKLKNKYDYIAFTDGYGRPYIYVLFYTNTLPSEYWRQSIVSRDMFGFYNVSKVGKYVFRKQLVDPSDNGKKVLYIGRVEDIPNSFKKIRTINFLDGNPAFVIAER